MRSTVRQSRIAARYPMLTRLEEEEWIQLARRVPRSVVEGWYRDLLGCELEEVRWGIDDDADVNVRDYLFFVADTMCMHLSFRDPPAWLVYRVMKYVPALDNLLRLPYEQVPVPPGVAELLEKEFWNLLAGAKSET